jgi:membrane protein
MAKVTAKDVLKLAKSTVAQFMENNSFRLAAALAYNTIFSLPPLLLIIVSAAGAIWGDEAVSGKLASEMQGMMGEEAAKEIQTMISNANKSGSGGIASAFGIAMLIFAATTFFVTLQDSLNSIWNIKVKPKNGILKVAKDRFLSFGLILSIALLLLVSLVISATLTFFTDYLQNVFPAVAVVFIHIFNLAVSLGIITLLFAMIYRYLPDAIIRWKDIWVGAFFNGPAICAGQFFNWLVLGHQRCGFDLRRGRFGYYYSGLDLLFVAYPVLWLRIYPAVRRAVWRENPA